MPVEGAQDSGNADAQAIAHPAPAQARPKTRQKRPRPLFDDGALTRTFKFPSKKYPRSSYYVTSTEIIIRIKKARKKWKLVVPKKRVVSYKTNRWFAKPRWVEIELTFTQASRLGLVEPRPAAKDGPPSPVIEPPATGQIVDPAPSTPENLELVASEAPETGAIHDTDNCDSNECVVELEADGDDIAPEMLDADVSVTEESEPVEDSGPARPLQEAPAEAPVPPCEPPPVITFAPAPVIEAVPAAMQPAAKLPVSPGTAMAKPRMGRSPGIAAYGIAASVLLLAVAASTSIEPDPVLERRLAALAPCERAALGLPCAQDIVTGSIAAPDSLPSVDAGVAPPVNRAPAVQNEKDVPLSFDAAAPQADHMLPSFTKTTPATNAAQEPSHEAAPPSVPELDPRAVKLASLTKPSSDAPDTATTAAVCDDINRAAQDIAIQFEYAKWNLASSSVDALKALAHRLAACPSMRLVIQGHTDSDGHTDRNVALSQRRAEAVRDHLVNSGARPEQISAVGLGQANPAVPNDSSANKRKNRRAVVRAERL